MVPTCLPPGERIASMQTQQYKYKVKIETTKETHTFCGTSPDDERPPFALKDEFKAMRGARWLGTYDAKKNPLPRPVWQVENCRRNNFNIDYLEGKNPFARYKTPLDEKNLGNMTIPRTRKDWHGKEWNIFGHQIEFTLHMLQRRQCIIAGEMGTGKTLSAFLAMELSCVEEAWYVAPKSALASVKLEAMRWCLRTKVRFMTYDELKKVLSEWVPGKPPPKMVFFDESSRVKTASSQRSQAAMFLAESMRDTWGDDAYIILMSGSPAPKSPLDWYQQCEIACPGYIREGNIHKFEQRLAILEKTGDTTGFSWSKRIAWRDGNPNICGICGRHTSQHAGLPHDFKAVDNQIEAMYRRMSGLVLVKFKKDCLDLPDKVYRVITLKPSRELMSAARIVTSKAHSVIEGMTLLRELSDGFQYKDTLEKTAVCESCKGTRIHPETTPGVVRSCDFCSGTGVQNSFKRETVEIPSPKLDALTDLLDEVEDQGRLVVYAGFTGSIDRICAHVKKLGWEYIRVDGRGWSSSIGSLKTDLSMLQAFQNPAEYGQIVFVGHPGSAGMGITLTAASMICYFSNDFNAESRIQSEDRIHRAGMDTNRGATIVDLILLPTDKKVLDNLSRKRELQSISLGEIKSAIDNYSFTSA